MRRLFAQLSDTSGHDDEPVPTEPDELQSYRLLIELLFPEGLGCPRCGAREGLKVHRRRRAPVLDYLCTHCFRVFNAWTGTVLQGTHRSPSQIVRILRGISEKVPTAHLARELGCQRTGLVALRRRWKVLAPTVVEREDSAALRTFPPGPGERTAGFPPS